MRQRLLRLFFWGPIVSVAVAGFLLLSSLRLAHTMIQETGLAVQLSAEDRDACYADPPAWGWRSGDITIFAYDQAGRSANPDAPPIERDLLRRAKASGQPVQRRTSERLTWVISNFGEGPCATLRGTIENVEPQVATCVLTVFIAGTVGGMLLATAGTYLFVVRPLRNRIDGLTVAARAVGSSAFSPPLPSPDALENIDNVLARSHGQIVSARDHLECRSRALKEHLAGIAHNLRTPLLVDATSGTVDLYDLVRRLEKRFVVLGRHAGIGVVETTPERSIDVACSPTLAERAVANIVQNAVEHNTAPGHVAIRLVLTNSGRRFELVVVVVVVVVDDGPELPADRLTSLQNETFLTNESSPRRAALGLLITTEVARRAQWSVSYKASTPIGLQVRLMAQYEKYNNDFESSTHRSYGQPFRVAARGLGSIRKRCRHRIYRTC